MCFHLCSCGFLCVPVFSYVSMCCPMCSFVFLCVPVFLSTNCFLCFPVVYLCFPMVSYGFPCVSCAFLDSFVLLCSPVFSYYLQCPCGFMCCPLRSSRSFVFICFHFVSIVIVSFGFNCFISSLGNVVSTAAGSRHPLDNMHIKYVLLSFETPSCIEKHFLTRQSVSWIPLFSCVLLCLLIIYSAHVGSCVVLCALLFSCVFICFYVVSIVIVSFVLNCFRSSLGNVISTAAGSRHPFNHMHIKYFFIII